MPEPKFDSTESKLKDPGFLAQVRAIVAEKLEDIATDPEFAGCGFELDMGERVLRGEKVSGGPLVEGAIVMVGQDFRLTHEEIEEMRAMFIEKK